MAAQMNRVQAYLSDIQGLYTDAYRHQVEHFVTAQEHFSDAMKELMGSRTPDQLVRAQTAFLSALIEETSAQTKAAVELVEKLQSRLAEMADMGSMTKTEPQENVVSAQAAREPPRGGKTVREVETA